MKKEIKFKTSAELADHLRNVGDVYTECGARLCFDKNITEGSPYRIAVGDASSSIEGYWHVNDFRYHINQLWEDCIPEGKGVPCYVSDSVVSPTQSDSMDVIHSFGGGKNYPYVASNCEWKYATPIPADKLWIPDNE